MKLATLLQNAQRQLAATSLSPQTDVEYLLCHLLQKNRSYLISHADNEINPMIEQQFLNLVQQRIQGQPIAYLIGRQGFWKHDFQVSPATLIPRPETELLVETALRLLPLNRPCKILDLGTGSGAIAISLALECKNWQVTAIDQSLTALEIAQNNAKRLQAHNVIFLQSNWFQALPQQKFDLIISNPPYIHENDPHLHQGDLRFEPQMALTSGALGLDAITHITRTAPQFLRPEGWLLLEHGYDQQNKIQNLFAQAGFIQIQTLLDLNGLPRVSLGKHL